MNNHRQKSISAFSGQVGDLVKGSAITIALGKSVGEAARLMSEARVGSLVVVSGKKPVGIVTKTDLVRRVLARDKGGKVQVSQVMTPQIQAVDRSALLFDGLMQMIQHRIGHLVVMDRGRVVGVVSDRDWLAYQKLHPLALVKDMEQAETVAELAELREKANGLVSQFFREEGTAEMLTELVTEINDRTVRQVIALTLKAMKTPPPVKWAWMAMGSEGRLEQTLSTDQDNGLIFEAPHGPPPPSVRKWFLGFAERVVSGLETCGFPRCKGNIMATNPELCLSLGEWKEMFGGLVDEVNPTDLIRASIYFDFRCLEGEPSLVDALRKDLLKRIGKNRGFLRFMAGRSEFYGDLAINSFSWRVRALFGLNPPPVDLKKEGISPMVRATRVLALAHGIEETNTIKRLALIQKKKKLPNGLGEAVRHAYDFIMLLRIRNNFRQQENQESPHNRVDFNSLNQLEFRFLVESLKTIDAFQDFVWGEFGEVTIQ